MVQLYYSSQISYSLILLFACKRLSHTFTWHDGKNVHSHIPYLQRIINYQFLCWLNWLIAYLSDPFHLALPSVIKPGRLELLIHPTLTSQKGVYTPIPVGYLLRSFFFQISKHYRLLERIFTNDVVMLG